MRTTQKRTLGEMKKIRDEIKILTYLKQDCRTVESISQYKYAGYLSASRVVEKVVLSVEKTMQFEQFSPVSIVIFTPLFDQKIKEVISKFDQKNVMLVSSSSVISTAKNFFPKIETAAIVLRKMRAINTVDLERKIMAAVVSFVERQLEKYDGVSIYSGRKIHDCCRGSINNMRFFCNNRAFFLARLRAYQGFIMLLSLLYFNEYSNNSSAIKKISEMVDKSKSLLRKCMSKKTVNYCRDREF